MKEICVKAIVCDICKKTKPETSYTPSMLIYGNSRVCRRCIKNRDIKKNAGWIYLITNRLFDGYCKPGTTTDVEKRLRTYQTSDPFRDYTMEFKLWVEDTYFYEEYFKQKCAALRVRENGEWYSMPYYVAVEVLKAADTEYKKIGREALSI